MSPRIRTITILLLAAVVLTVGLRLPAAPVPVLEPLVHGVGGVAITVSDMDRAVRFYSRVLSFEKRSDVEVTGSEYERLHGVFGVRLRVVRMQLGSESIELMEYLTPRGRRLPPDSRSNDRWFQHIAVIVSDMEVAYEWLRLQRVEHSSPAPQRLPDWNPNAAGIRAFYFKDPDGHPLEILEFPAGKGDSRWQRPGGGTFLGIDHTAIVVGDTEASLAFYRDTLGMRLVGESQNYGPEQERLNNVFGARLRITTLRAPTGPAVELLEYLTPRDGRGLGPDARANDLVTWQTLLQVSDPLQAERSLKAARVPFVSPGIVAFADAPLGFGQGFVARDPDGHAMQFRAK